MTAFYYTVYKTAQQNQLNYFQMKKDRTYTTKRFMEIFGEGTVSEIIYVMDFLIADQIIYIN
jgi:hypothetical protein